MQITHHPELGNVPTLTSRLFGSLACSVYAVSMRAVLVRVLVGATTLCVALPLVMHAQSAPSAPQRQSQGAGQSQPRPFDVVTDDPFFPMDRVDHSVVVTAAYDSYTVAADDRSEPAAGKA